VAGAGAERSGAVQIESADVRLPPGVRESSLATKRRTQLNKSITREIRSCSELQAVCLETLKQCQGFEQVNEVLVQPRENAEGLANWTLAAVRPRVDNKFLRAAGGAIAYLQQTYQLGSAEILAERSKRRR
jgi:hypothetical protein